MYRFTVVVSQPAVHSLTSVYKRFVTGPVLIVPADILIPFWYSPHHDLSSVPLFLIRPSAGRCLFETVNGCFMGLIVLENTIKTISV